MTTLDKFIARLNQKPMLWTLALGLIVYFCAFWISVFAMFPSITPLFEIGFLFAGSLVVAYHWAMSRYLAESKLAQIVHLCFGLVLVTASMALIGATTHVKSYDWLTQWLFL
jgi:hypothetical protein